MNRFGFVILGSALSVLGATGCSAVQVSATHLARALDIIDEPAAVAPKTAPPEFREALQLIGDQKFEPGLVAIDAFLKKEPTSPWTQSANYHRGRALEGLGRPSEAASQYRSVVSATEKIAPKLQAMALYRMSFCHEALGEEQQTLADLHDLLTRSGSLPKEVSGAELPARLAGAYARVGNFEKAVSFYRIAETGITQLKRGSSGIPEWLPRTLYSMGAVSSRNVGWDDFETALRPLSRSQIYLLQAAELNATPWSEQAARELAATYTRLWSVIESPPEIKASEPLLAERSIQQIQLTRAELLLETLRELKARSLSTEPNQGSESSREALKFADDLEAKVSALFNQRPIGEGPTAESKQRRSTLRGRTLNTDDSLEKKFIKSSRAVPSKDQDPNL